MMQRIFLLLYFSLLISKIHFECYHLKYDAASPQLHHSRIAPVAEPFDPMETLTHHFWPLVFFFPGLGK